MSDDADAAHCDEGGVEFLSLSDDAGEASEEAPKTEKTVRDSGENVRGWGRLAQPFLQPTPLLFSLQLFPPLVRRKPLFFNILTRPADATSSPKFG